MPTDHLKLIVAGAEQATVDLKWRQQAELDEFWPMFHRAWGIAKDLPNYDKKAWGYVQNALNSAARAID